MRCMGNVNEKKRKKRKKKLLSLLKRVKTAWKVEMVKCIIVKYYVVVPVDGSHFLS